MVTFKTWTNKAEDYFRLRFPCRLRRLARIGVVPGAANAAGRPVEVRCCIARAVVSATTDAKFRHTWLAIRESLVEINLEKQRERLGGAPVGFSKY